MDITQLLSDSAILLGILLIYVAGAALAFEVVLEACAVFILFGWVSIFFSHLGYRKAVACGRVPASPFRMPGSPWTDYGCLVFLAAVALYLMFDLSNPTWWHSLLAGLVIVVGTNVGFEIARRRSPRTPATGA